MTQPSKVFIAYGEEDKEFAESIYESVEKLGLECYAFTKVHRSGNWIPETDLEEIKSSEYFVVIITSNSINSQWVNQEIGVAYALGKRFIPICEENIISEIKGFIQNVECIRYRTGSYSNEEECISEIVLKLREEKKIDKVKIVCKCGTKHILNLPPLDSHREFVKGDDKVLVYEHCSICGNRLIICPLTLKVIDTVEWGEK